MIDQEQAMDVVTVSPKYQVVIPLRVRRSLGLKPGQKVQVLLYNNRIELVPIIPTKKTRGFLKGINTRVERDPDRR
jgi:AbrB family looped-hinge helix DNA binding protein